MKVIHEQLKDILNTMDVSISRKNTEDIYNLRWLKRNLFIRNKEHLEFPTAVHFINTLLTMHVVEVYFCSRISSIYLSNIILRDKPKGELLVDLSKIKVGDIVTRLVANSLRMSLSVTKITEKEIICGPWKFSKITGGEIDEDLDWDGINTGSLLE